MPLQLTLSAPVPAGLQLETTVACTINSTVQSFSRTIAAGDQSTTEFSFLTAAVDGPVGCTVTLAGTAEPLYRASAAVYEASFFVGSSAKGIVTVTAPSVLYVFPFTGSANLGAMNNGYQFAFASSLSSAGPPLEAFVAIDCGSQITWQNYNEARRRRLLIAPQNANNLHR